MLANLSTKTKLSYIGNKGLGFRSILNWSENVAICTRNCRISFSENIAKKIFENDLKLNPADKQKIRKARNLSAKAIPFPVLAVPVINEDYQPTSWATRIEIACRKNS
ncbi:hypothetical protein [Mucilaginibacter antarcticus]|uniref:hypothetical protein n=1 Tax=Mucilaginibacter antarcticus TaxID=1855725 RepID=UPI00363A4E0D